MIWVQNVAAIVCALQLFLSHSLVVALSTRPLVPLSTSSSNGASVPIADTKLNRNGKTEMSKVESSAVQRFKRYDKLCKTCPTLLQPKVSTLEEMIMGLSATERNELLSNVSRRIEQEQNQSEREVGGEVARQVRTARDVYQFQTGEQAGELNEITTFPTEKKVKIEDYNYEEPPVKMAHGTSRLVEKMNKTRNKFERNKLGLERMEQLIDFTEMLLSTNNNEPNTVITDMRNATTDPDVYHRMDELQDMSRAELKMQRLKYVAQKMKHAQKIAKGRMKLYGASLKLARQETN